MPRYALRLAYKGTAYHGWQVQANAHTVQAELNRAMSLLLREPADTLGCGRTDTGVHALQFYIHFDTEQPVISNFVYKLNQILPDDIVIYELYTAAPDFHARFSATLRSYEYIICRVPDPFMVHRAWHWHQQLNIEKMNEAASLLLTYTNFESFSKVHTQVDNFNCDVSKAVWKQEGSQYKFYISANRFLRNMVRAIVGTTVEVGNSKLDVDGFKEIIEQRDRRKAGESVPAQGLYLTEVIYPDGLLTSLQSL